MEEEKEVKKVRFNDLVSFTMNYRGYCSSDMNKSSNISSELSKDLYEEVHIEVPVELQKELQKTALPSDSSINTNSSTLDL